MKIVLEILFFSIAIALSAADKYRIAVIDSISSEPIGYAAYFLNETGVGGLTDENGSGYITPINGKTMVNVTMMGYKAKTVDLKKAVNNELIVKLSPEGVQLDEVTVKKRREHYSKKNNPAVELMRKVRASSEKTDPNEEPHFNYEKYEKITIAANNYNAHIDEGKKRGQFDFLKEYADTSDILQNTILNLSVKEKYSSIYNSREPRTTREIIHGVNNVGVDQMLDQASVQTFLNDVMREIDIYDNDITLLQYRFVGPLSHISAEYYKFYLTDSIGTGADKVMVLSFVPRVSSTMGFTGRLFIAVGDSTYMVKRAIMNVPAEINLNFVKSLHLDQQYVLSDNGRRLKLVDDMAVELSVFGGNSGLFVRRLTNQANHNFDDPDNAQLFKNRGDVITERDANYRDEQYWEENRLSPISRGESRLSEMIDRMRSRPLYFWGERLLKIMVNGYIATSTKKSKVDLGPVNALISGNDVEGVRLRVGGMTTANLSPRWFGRGYVAYGTKDKKLKYSGEVEYSFIDKNYHSREFPVQSLRFTHQYDVDMIGQHYLFTNADNFFMALTRMKNRLMTYRRLTELRFTHERHNNFMFTGTLKHVRQEATATVPFKTASGQYHRHYDESTVTVGVRFAPGEKFYQAASYRVAINFDAPVFTLEHTFGPKGFAGNSFEVNRTEASIQKRFWFSAFGYLDAVARGGHVWSATPFPSLLLPNANLSYIIQPEGYALMNPMEFISDSYGSLDLTYWANGAIFNYVPLLRKLKWREVIGFRGYLGTLSKKNKPSIDNNLYEFPSLALATPMHGHPYMEMSVGIDNFLKILRVDYVWRLTYRSTPGVDRNGIRVLLHITF